MMFRKTRAVAEMQPALAQHLGNRHGITAFVTVVLLSLFAVAQPPDIARAGAAAESYVAENGGTMIAAGRTEIDGRLMSCGTAPTVLDPHYPDFGSSFPGFIVLNPKLFAGLPTAVKLWIFSHECAHQKIGNDEVKADCVAVQRGRREGWLDTAGLAQVCAFMAPSRGDRSHFTGPKRCALMKACFAQEK
jgi:hypothetical protein